MSQLSMKKQKADPIWTFCLLALIIFGYMVITTLMVEADTHLTFADFIAEDEEVVEATVPESIPQGAPKVVKEPTEAYQEEQVPITAITPSEDDPMMEPTKEETSVQEVATEPITEVKPAQVGVMPILGGTTEVVEGMVAFDDPFFEACIRFVLDKPKGDITKEELLGITTLDLGSHFITDITGIEEIPHLKTLVLNDNSISDLSPLSGLTELDRLELQNNAITDISSLKNLTSLTYLDISGNQVADISTLLGLVQLNTLYVAENMVTDYSPLSQLQKVINRDYEPDGTKEGQKVTFDQLPVEEEPLPQENQTEEPKDNNPASDPDAASQEGQGTEVPIIDVP